MSSSDSVNRLLGSRGVADEKIPNPSAFLTWAHRDPGWGSAEASEWRNEVYAFCLVLRASGIEVDMDLFHLTERGIDWTRYGPKEIEDREWVVVALSRAWRDRWEGRNDPKIGAGAVAEADALKSVFNRNQQDFREKVVLVTLPSREKEDLVPTGLDGVQRFTLKDFSPERIEPLIRLLTGQPQYPAGALGAVPELAPAAELPIIPDEAEAPAETEEHPTTTAERSVRAIDELLGARKEALKKIPPPEAGEGPHLPWSRAWHQLNGEIESLERERDEAEARERLQERPNAESTAVAEPAPVAAFEASARAGISEPPAPKERDLLDAARPTPGGPDHRMLHDGSLLHRVIVRPAPPDARGPRGSEMSDVLDRAAAAVEAHGRADWKASPDAGLYREVRRAWASPEPRVWHVGWTTADATELARRPTAAAAISTKPLVLTFERTYPTRMQLSEGRGIYYAAHDLEIVRDTAAAILFAGSVIAAAGDIGHVDVLAYVGAAPADQELVPADSYAASNDPFDAPYGEITPNPPFAPTRYMDVLRMTPQAMVDTPDEVTLELLDDWLAAFRTRNTLDDLRYSPASMTST
jgi:hypothetical protein